MDRIYRKPTNCSLEKFMQLR